MRPSVYEIEAARPTLVRTHAEHTAGNALNPPNGFVNFDLTGWRVVEVSDGACHFEFASKAHRELVFEDEAKLAAFIGSLLEERGDREYVTNRAELVAYAASRIGDNDTEWLAFCSKCTASHSKVWRCPNP